MNTLTQPPKTTGQTDTSWATNEALAILAVDNIRPSAHARQLMQDMDDKKLTYEQAIQAITERIQSSISQ